MADSYWIWSHGFKVHDEKYADPLLFRFTQEQLEAMSDMENMAAAGVRTFSTQRIPPSSAKPTSSSTLWNTNAL